MDLYRLTLHELRDLIREGEVSPVQAVEAYAARIGAVDERVQAFNSLTTEAALRRARKIEGMQAKKEPLPPLAGIPLAIRYAPKITGHPADLAAIFQNSAPFHNLENRRLRRKNVVDRK